MARTVALFLAVIMMCLAVDVVGGLMFWGLGEVFMNETFNSLIVSLAKFTGFLLTVVAVCCITALPFALVIDWLTPAEAKK